MLEKNTSFWIVTSYGKLGLLRVYTAEVRTEGSQTGTNKVGKICTTLEKKGMREL